MAYMKDTPTEKLEADFEAEAKSQESYQQDWLEALTEAAEKKQEEMGVGECNLDDPEGCESCSG